jgi:hypothetical protein
MAQEKKLTELKAFFKRSISLDNSFKNLPVPLKLGIVIMNILDKQ